MNNDISGLVRGLLLHRRSGSSRWNKRLRDGCSEAGFRAWRRVEDDPNRGASPTEQVLWAHCVVKNHSGGQRLAVRGKRVIFRGGG
jgi:hypothetical protein